MISVLLAASRASYQQPTEQMPSSLRQPLWGYCLWPQQCPRVFSQPVWSGACWLTSQWAQVCCLLSSLGMTQWSGEFYDSTVANLVPPGLALSSVLGLPPKPQGLGPLEGGWHGCGYLSLLLSWFSRPSLWIRLWEGQGLPSLLSAPPWRKEESEYSKLFTIAKLFTTPISGNVNLTDAVTFS